MIRLGAVGLAFFAAPCGRADAISDWARVTQLDAGPGTGFKTQEEARAGAAAHLDRQEAAVRQFLSAHAQDPHAFEGRMRLARLLQIRATFQQREGARVEAGKLLDELDRSATAAQRVEVDFARLTFLMRTMRKDDRKQRETLLSATRRFQADFGADRRVPALLAEVATIFDRDPETQRSLIADAQKLATDPALKDRLADDLKRLNLLGQPVAFRCTNAQGRALDLADYRGKVVVLCFFADFSPPATEAVTELQRAYPLWPAGSVQMLGFSLDQTVEELRAFVNRTNLTWPIGFDGKGWRSPLARELGINRLPTVWLIDQAGRLRSLNGLEDTLDSVRQLLKTAP